MDGIQLYEWIRSFTFFNWLALFAFIFSLISVSNALFSLRSRFRDWRATKSQKEFEKRLQQLKDHLDQVEKYRKSNTIYYRFVIHEAIGLVILFIGVLFCFVTFFLSFIQPTGATIFRTLAGVSGMLSLMRTFTVTFKFYRLTGYVNDPEILAIKIIGLLKNGKAKGLVPKDDDKIIESILKSDMFTMAEMKAIMDHKDKSLKLTKP